MLDLYLIANLASSLISIQNPTIKEEKIGETHVKWTSWSTQFLGVEATTELCLFEGPEGGIGTPLGKKLKTRPL